MSVYNHCLALGREQSITASLPWADCSMHLLIVLQGLKWQHSCRWQTFIKPTKSIRWMLKSRYNYIVHRCFSWPSFPTRPTSTLCTCCWRERHQMAAIVHIPHWHLSRSGVYSSQPTQSALQRDDEPVKDQIPPQPWHHFCVGLQPVASFVALVPGLGENADNLHWLISGGPFVRVVPFVWADVSLSSFCVCVPQLCLPQSTSRLPPWSTSKWSFDIIVTRMPHATLSVRAENNALQCRLLSHSIGPNADGFFEEIGGQFSFRDFWLGSQPSSIQLSTFKCRPIVWCLGIPDANTVPFLLLALWHANVSLAKEICNAHVQLWQSAFNSLVCFIDPVCPLSAWVPEQCLVHDVQSLCLTTCTVVTFSCCPCYSHFDATQLMMRKPLCSTDMFSAFFGIGIPMKWHSSHSHVRRKLNSCDLEAGTAKHK